MEIYETYEEYDWLHGKTCMQSNAEIRRMSVDEQVSDHNVGKGKSYRWVAMKQHVWYAIRSQCVAKIWFESVE